MYEVLNVKRMMEIKSYTVRNRKKPPTSSNSKTPWRSMIVVSSGTPLEKLKLLPEGSEIKLCLQDRSIWEVFIPNNYKKSVKLLAKRLDAIAFL